MTGKSPPIDTTYDHLDNETPTRKMLASLNDDDEFPIIRVIGLMEDPNHCIEIGDVTLFVTEGRTARDRLKFATQEAGAEHNHVWICGTKIIERHHVFGTS